MRAAVATLFVLLALPAGAGAATAERTGGCDRYGNCNHVVEVRAEPGEANAMTITRSPAAPAGGDVVIRDAGARWRAGTGCQVVATDTVRCEYAYSVDVSAGDRDDTIDATGFAASVTLRGGPGADVLSAPPNAWLSGGPGLDTFTGGATVDYSGARTPVAIDLDADTAVTADGTERIAGIVNATGGHADDRLAGDGAANKLDGGPGEDVLLGGDEGDHLLGGRGTDVLRGEGGDDTLGSLGSHRPRDRSADLLDCGSGRDTVEPADAPMIVDASCELLYSDVFSHFRLRTAGRDYLPIPRSAVGPPARISATLRIPGSRRVERRLSFSVQEDDVEDGNFFIRGHRRLWLDSKRIRAARRRGPVVVVVDVRGVFLGPDRQRYRTRLRFRLGRYSSRTPSTRTMSVTETDRRSSASGR